MNTVPNNKHHRNMNTSNHAHLEEAEALMKTKPWTALTPQERSVLRGIADSETAYMAMREHLLSVEAAMASDLPDLEPDPAILSRLQNTMALKPKQPQIHKQSFGAVFMGLFSLQSLGLKTSLAAFVLVASFWFGQHGANGIPGMPIDSTSTLLVDSSEVSKGDTAAYSSPMLFIHY